MKSRVYFARTGNSGDMEAVKTKLSCLVKKSRLLDFIGKGEKVVIKMHFGEEGNAGFVRPEYLRIVCDAVIGRQAEVFLSDTNTLYRGRRMNSGDHLRLAYEHGFVNDRAGAEVVIPDETRKEDAVNVEAGGRLIKTAKIASVFLQSDAVIGVSHFKGHIMTGFGGALKNIGMGCATREGKLAQHSDIAPLVIKKLCQGCGVCIGACPAKAISIGDKKSFINDALCIGCAACIAACPAGALDVNWEAGGVCLQEKMIEYAAAVLRQKINKAAFLNFAIKITRECDCLAKDDPLIAPDVGIFASRDPVSIDKAAFDSIIKAAGKDVFREAHPQRDGSLHLNYAAALGLGNLDYELCEVG